MLPTLLLRRACSRGCWWFYLFISSSDGSEHEAPRRPSSLGTDACAKTSNGTATASPKGTLLTTSYSLTYSDVEIASHSLHGAKRIPSDICSALNADFRKKGPFC